MLSEVMMGKIGTPPKPVIVMIAPVIIRGEYGGYTSGTLSLEQIWEYIDQSTDENTMLYTLIDKNDNVIMTNRTDQTVMTPFVRGKLAMLFLILLGALVLAELLSRWSIVTLEKLRLITQDLPDRLSTDGKEIAPGASRPRRHCGILTPITAL